MSNHTIKKTVVLAMLTLLRDETKKRGGYKTKVLANANRGLSNFNHIHSAMVQCDLVKTAGRRGSKFIGKEVGQPEIDAVCQYLQRKGDQVKDDLPRQQPLDLQQQAPSPDSEQKKRAAASMQKVMKEFSDLKVGHNDLSYRLEQTQRQMNGNAEAIKAQLDDLTRKVTALFGVLGRIIQNQVAQGNHDGYDLPYISTAGNPDANLKAMLSDTGEEARE